MKRAPYRLAVSANEGSSFALSWHLYDVAGKRIADGYADTFVGARWEARRKLRRIIRARGELWI